jgi:hypothetical protein
MKNGNKRPDPIRSIFGFHTGYHQPNAFLTRNPGFIDLARAPDKAIGEKWHDVEIGRKGRKLWMKINGKTILDAKDPHTPPLPGGQIGLRLRGPGNGTFSCLYKDLSVHWAK